ncbi:IPTL-CTERM sorting domain-containing protein [Delftia acidovorans]|uniref:IPTL-CTERM sorting domain-containing protein n=1 Tax=Delftia acidovorans TaxID=80866 RepID=UPI0035E43849
MSPCVPADATDVALDGHTGSSSTGGSAGSAAPGSPGNGGDRTQPGKDGRVMMAFTAVPVGPGASTSIPTLSEWGLIFTSSMLALFGIARMRRRQC